ncbi:MAG: hypothetical protein ACI8TP_001231 [Acidimicrobiales bacterium]|jgi:hypothetical protein
MERLTGDGRAVLADGIHRLPADIRDEVVDRLCADGDPAAVAEMAQPNLLDWNYGRREGGRAVEALCATEE